MLIQRFCFWQDVRAHGPGYTQTRRKLVT